MVSAGVIIALVIFCVLAIVGTVLGVYYSKVACPDFGSECTISPAPGPAPGPSPKSPGPAPAPALTPRTPGPSPGPSTPGSLISTSTNCPTKEPGTYYTSLNSCATAPCTDVTGCMNVEHGTKDVTCYDAYTDPIQGTYIPGSPGGCTFVCDSGYTRSGPACILQETTWTYNDFGQVGDMQ